MQKIVRAVGALFVLGMLALNFVELPLPNGLPDRVYVEGDQVVVLNTGLPLTASVSATSNGEQVYINGVRVGQQGARVDLAQPLHIAVQGQGTAKVSFKVGGVTIRNMSVVVNNNRTILPSGRVIGVAMYTRGALVVSTGNIMLADGGMKNPGQMAGIAPGDIILAVNGEEINNADHLLSQLITNIKASLELTILRGDTTKKVTITPLVDALDQTYRLGLWVRDSTAGIGTVTYTDASNLAFGSLGHPIADVDTNQTLLLKEGMIVPARVFDIVKGTEGQPGELSGMFITSGNALGKIMRNVEVGLFGKLYAPMASALYPDGLPIGWQSEVKEGAATLLCTLDGQTVEEFACEIVRVNRQKASASKGMVIEITDPRLLSKTNGIVQGMSGSPLIQNGKIIGAVTHVLVNDPHRGYGVFIEWMLEQSDGL